jgi:hypothetical protein
MQVADNSATLTVELRVSQQVIELAYSVSNRTPSEIYLFNRMYDDVDVAGNFQVDKNICNIEVIDSKIVVSKKIPAIPDSIDVEIPYIPCVTLVAAGDEFTESIQLRLPLKPGTPYVTCDQPIRPVTLPVFFELGYFVGRPGTRALAETVATTVGPSLRFDPFTEAAQMILRAGPLSLIEVFECVPGD